MADGKGEDSADKPEPVTSMPAVTEQEREFAQQAGDEFDKRNYDACMGLLGKLAPTRSSDPRLAHNKAVVEYYKSGFTKTDEFIKAMQEVHTKAQVNVDNINALDDVDQCVLYYNHAVLLYHQRQYRKALLIMDKLFQFIEPMEENLCRKVMFLLVELYLSTHQPEKAMGMVGFIEKTLFGNGKSSQPTPEREKDGGKEAGKDSREGSAEVSSNEMWRPRISQYKARCYMMLKSMKSCKREVKSLMNTMGMTIPIVYLKANFEYLRGNFRKAIKVLNTCPQSGRPITETGECLNTMYANNMAVIHFNMRKHNLGAFYLRKAYQENENACKDFAKVEPGKSLSGRPIQTLSLSCHHELQYNMGIQLLHCSKPLAAFDCLLQTVQLYRINPRLWLRLAECCIMANRQNNDEDRKLHNRMKVIESSVGSGIHRKLILGSGLSKDQVSVESGAIPQPTLEFAALCLTNALMLLPEDPLTAQPATAEEGQEPRQNFENVMVPAPPGNPMRGSEVANLRCSILASSAYVALCLNDHQMALQHAERLLKQPRLSGAHRYLGHLYLAEALVHQDRIADSVSHLNPENITDISTLFPEHKEQDKTEKNGEKDPQENSEAKGSLYPWSPRDLPQARAVMQYNLAVAHANRGEYDKASLHLAQSIQNIGSPPPAQMYFLMLYLELMEGHHKNAHTFIREHFGHVTLNR